MIIRKAVIPAAGEGVRLHPITRLIPKEMLPVLNKPLIQYAIEELVEAKISQIAIITSSRKPLIKQYLTSSSVTSDKSWFSKNIELEFIIQDEPKGLGNAILHAKDFVGNSPFIVCLPDDLVFHSMSAVRQLMTQYELLQNSLVGIVKVPREQIPNYGIVKPIDQSNQESFDIQYFIEKPIIEDAPSNLAVIGRYLFDSLIMDQLGELSCAVPNNELLNSAMNSLAKKRQISAVLIAGTRVDAGSVLGITQASTYQLLQNSPLGSQLRIFLESITNRN